MLRDRLGVRSWSDLAAVPFGFFRDPLLGEGRWIFYSALIGLVSGIGAILFDLVFRAAQWGLLSGLGRFQPPGAGGEGGPGFGPEAPWMLPIVLVAGALISGAIVFSLAPEAEGHGTDAVLDAFHRKLGRIRRRIPLVKAISSAVTIGSGGSAGREGPIAQIGAGFGSFVGDLLGLSARDRRVMMMAGVAGGIGGIFRAPLGATLFSAEILYSTTDFEHEVLLPGLISAITSYSIYSGYAGWGFMFDMPDIAFHRPRQLLVYLALGIVCAAIGSLYPRVFYGVRDRVFRPLPLPRWLKPAVGALVLGLIGVVFPEALGMGYGYIQQAMDGQRTASFLFALAVIKIVATSLTISSGGSGGVFGPSLVIGGALGGAFGLWADANIPSFAPEPAAAIMVGMGGFFAGVARVPFASVIMVMEMTGSYGLLVPSLLVAAIAFLFVPRTSRLYENQVPRRIDSPAHLGSFAMDILAGGRVGDVWEPGRAPLTVTETTPLSKLVDKASGTSQSILPVVDADGRLVGEIALEDIRRALTSEDEPESVTASALAVEAREPLTPSDDLARAARLLAGRPAAEATVVDHLDTRRVIGTFSRRDLIVAYGRRVQGLHRIADAEP